MPKPLDCLGDTNIVRLEGVQRNSESDGSNSQSPHGDSAGDRDALSWEVIDDA